MGWSTSVISPPDGDMSAYLASLRLLLDRDDALYWPTHGPAILEPKRHVEAFIAHRQEREQQILDAIGKGVHRIEDMVPDMYKGTPEFLYPAAARSVFAAVQGLIDQGTLRCEGSPSLDSSFHLS